MGDRSYLVGYSKPPVATRFQKGVSGNPTGRPAKAPSAAPLESDGLSISNTIVLAEALRPITVRENDKPTEMPLIQAVLRSLGVAAVKGDRKAQFAIAAMYKEALAEQHTFKLAVFEQAVLYKEYWQQQFNECDRTDSPRPEPVPHPDDMILDASTLEVRINGPSAEFQEAEWRQYRAMSAQHSAEAAALNRKLRKSGKSEPDAQKKIDDTLELAGLINWFFPDEKIRRTPGFDLTEWRLAHPRLKQIQKKMQAKSNRSRRKSSEK